MKKILLSALMLAAANGLNAQSVTMRDVFSQMPDTVLPYLSHNNRLDLVDFMESGMEADVTNGFDEHTRMTALTSDYAKVSLSPASSLEMKLLHTAETLPDSAGHILCVVYTMVAEVASSTVRFYTSRWMALADVPDPIAEYAGTLLSRPDTMGVDEFNSLKLSLSPIIIRANLSETEETLTMSISPSVFSEEEKNKVKPILKQTTLKWTGKTFKES